MNGETSHSIGHAPGEEIVDRARWGRAFRWLLTCLVFFAFPLVFLAFGFGNHWRVQEGLRQQQEFAGLDAVLISIRQYDAPERFFAEVFRRLLALVETAENPERAMRNGLRRIKKRFPGIFHVTVTDRNGAVIPFLSEKHAPATILRRLYHALTMDGESAKKQALAGQWAIFRTFLGPCADLETLAGSPGRFLEVSLNAKKRWVAFFSSLHYGVFVHLDQPEAWELQVADDQCKRVSRDPRNALVAVGVLDMSEPGNFTPELKEVLAEFNRTRSRHLVIAGALFSVMGYSTTSYLWARRTIDESRSLPSSRLYLVGGETLLFAILALLAFIVIICDRPIRLSIRLRLVTLLAFAVGLPLMVGFFAGWDYLQQKHRFRVKETFDESEQILRAFESRFLHMRESIEKQLGGFLKGVDGETPSGKRRLQGLPRHFAFRHCSEILLFDLHGRVVWKAPAKEGGRGSHLPRQLLEETSRQVLAHLGQRKKTIPGELWKGISLSWVLEKLGTIVDFSVGGTRNWSLFFPLKGRSGEASYLLCAMWGKSDLERLYVRQNLISAQRQLAGGRLFAWETAGEIVGEIAGERLFPENRHLRKRLSGFRKRLALRGTTTTADLSAGRNGYLVTGVRPKEFAGMHLIALVPSKPLLADIRSLRIRLVGLAMGSVFFSILLGIALSRRVLQPVRDLTVGLQAVHQRRFHHRLPVRHRDELGDLAATCNRVLESLASLEVGRIVQEKLFPKEVVSAGPCRLFGETSAASELGGDYFDYRSLPDGRLLFLIGDVSGHGVPAALVMAMAKALVERECELTPVPADILEAMHQVFLHTLKRKRMMTCFLAILDPMKQELSFANAGHNYPYWFHADGSAEMLVSNALPLGSRKHLGLQPQRIKLAPGDRLLLYTDGLIEAKLAGGAEIGYERLGEGVKPLLGDDPRKTLADIRMWHQQLTGMGPQEDDITLVLLCAASSSGKAGGESW
jgi:HAMP domain-containing protein